jgi:hypothetical protein
MSGESDQVWTRSESLSSVYKSVALRLVEYSAISFVNPFVSNCPLEGLGSCPFRPDLPAMLGVKVGGAIDGTFSGSFEELA